MKTKIFLWLELLRFVYPRFLRPLIEKAVNDPDEEWDNIMLDIVDRMFQYKPEE